MTDRVNGVTVTFGKDMRVDDAQRLIDAISMIKGVVNVDTHIVTTDDHMATMRANIEFKNKLIEFMNTL